GWKHHGIVQPFPRPKRKTTGTAEGDHPETLPRGRPWKSDPPGYRTIAHGDGTRRTGVRRSRLLASSSPATSDLVEPRARTYFVTSSSEGIWKGAAPRVSSSACHASVAWGSRSNASITSATPSRSGGPAPGVRFRRGRTRLVVYGALDSGVR